MTKRHDHEDLGDVELPPDQEARAEAAIAAADEELDARVNFRWGKAQIDVVKRAAALAGVPYQTYLKQVVWQRAIEDIRAAQGAGVTRR